MAVEIKTMRKHVLKLIFGLLDLNIFNDTL